MTTLGMFTYPWDIAETGADAFVGELADLGVTRLAVATCYHSAELIAPTRRRNVAVHAEANVSHLPLPKGTFSDLAAPEGKLARERPTLYAEIAKAAKAKGLGVTGWTIAFHNTDMALANPDAAIEDCFGDKFAHALCPANPRARRYAKEMVAGLAKTGHFDTIMVESLSYLLRGHGHPHELWGVRMDVQTRFLLSLCFCPSCMAEGARRGLDGEALRCRVADELMRTWNSPLAVRRKNDDGTELAARLVLDKDFAGWVRMRCDAVNALAGEVAGIVHDAGLELEISAAVWGRPASLNWTEGVDIPANAKVADRFVLESYYPDAGDVARELDHVLGYVAPEKLGMVQTVWPDHHGSLAGLQDKIQMALDAGIGSISLYNYSMAPAPVVAWIKAVGEQVRRAGR